MWNFFQNQQKSNIGHWEWVTDTLPCISLTSQSIFECSGAVAVRVVVAGVVVVAVIVHVIVVVTNVFTNI